jgi:two-component system, cell cycle sensor histidine kinase and response regulator CckA
MSAAVEVAWSVDETDAGFRSLFEHLPLGTVRCAPEGTIVSCNPELTRLLTHSTAIAPSSFSDLIHPQDRAVCARLLSELSKRQRDSFQIRAELAGSTDKAVKWTVWRVPQVDGSTDHLLAMAEETSSGRTSEDRLQSDRLEAVGRLTGGIAHDFNNLLTAVLLYCDLLSATLGPDDRARTYAEEIRKAGLQATGLVRQLLSMTRPTNGEPRLLSLNDIVDGMRNLLERLIGDHIKLDFRLDPGLGLVNVNPTQAQQILLNLVLNARDAISSDGCITVETTDCRVQMLHPDAVGGHTLTLPCALFTVKDNGSGMDAFTRAHVFEPFFTTKAGKGTGLGLSTVHDIVTRNGGLIHIDSEVGQGARISVLLPIASRPVPNPESTQSSQSANGGEILLSKEEE